MTIQHAILDAGVPRQWLARDLYRRAAELFEGEGVLDEAAECWAGAGEPERAAGLYLQGNDHAHAAPLLLAAGRYAEALASFREWLSALHEDAPFGLATALLGASACLQLLERDPAEARDLYRRARSVMADERRLPELAGQCWEALGTHGATLGRHDLVQLGFERAIAAFGEDHPRERLRAARAYLAAARGNRLLAKDLEARIAAWRDAMGAVAPEPKYRLRSESITVSEEEILDACGLRIAPKAETGSVVDSWRPKEYIANEFEDRGDIIFDHATGLTWQKAGSQDWINYVDAEEYVLQLNRDRFGGYAGWRLPTVDELASLLEPEKQSNNLFINPLFDREQLFCWTSDQRSGGGAWRVSFDVGLVYWNLLGVDLYVRACRS